MSLQQTYTRFLSSPSADLLAPSASMHYVTTTATVNTADAIINHLKREHTVLKKRGEKVLSAVETADSLVLEIETEIEFLRNGGSYLPAMDENFLADQVVFFPAVSSP
jgi:hypothetical protein